jgi:hypothetical protein
MGIAEESTLREADLFERLRYLGSSSSQRSGPDFARGPEAQVAPEIRNRERVSTMPAALDISRLQSPNEVSCIGLQGLPDTTPT